MQDINLLDPTGLRELETFEDLSAVISKLRNDFDFHNHEGSSSRRLGNIIADSITTKAAIIGGYKLFEAVVGKTGSDFKTVAEALRAGKTRIFVRNGNYADEPPWTISNNYTQIVGESLGGVQITFADDTVNSQSIRVDSARFVLDNLGVVGYEGAEQTMFFFTSNGVFPTFTRLYIKNNRGKITESDVPSGIPVSVFGTFRDIYVDYKSVLSQIVAKGFYKLKYSTVENVMFDATGGGTTGRILAEGCEKVFFGSVKFIANESSYSPIITSSSDTDWVGCLFLCTEIQPNANFSNTTFISNNITPSAYFLEITEIDARLNNCRVTVPTAYNLLSCNGSNFQINNNRFTGGKKILLDNASVTIVAGSCIGNMWITDYDTAAPDLQIGAGTNYCNVFGNIIRNNKSGGSNTPTITDGGTGTIGVTLNQLILG